MTRPVKIIAAHPTILFSTSDKFLISFKDDLFVFEHFG